MKRLALLIVLAAALISASSASAHWLSKGFVRDYAEQIALKKCQKDSRCGYYSVSRCFRNGPHRVNCVSNRFDFDNVWYCSYWFNNRLPNNSNTAIWWINRNNCG
jgi:hypothetical protein